MGGSLIRSLLLVTESGINVYEHHMSESQLNSSQLISGMYTAFFTFFESEMAKGSVRSIELSRTKIIVFTYLDLKCIIEFERYCEELPISIMTNKTKELIATIISEKQVNPNRYIEQVEHSELSRIFQPSWQHDSLQEEQVDNLLDYFAIFKIVDAPQLLHLTSKNLTKLKNITTHSDLGRLDPSEYYEVNLTVESEQEYVIVAKNQQRGKILSHLRLITEFLTIIRPLDEMTLPYYLPYFQQTESNADFQQLLITYGWILPELVETLLIKRRLHIVGTDQSTALLEDILETLGLQGFFSISPFSADVDEIISEYDILRTSDMTETGYPLVNLYTNKTKNLVQSTIRDKMFTDSSPDLMLQILQEYFVKLENIHHDLFDMIFQINSSVAAEKIYQYRKVIDKFTWLLSLQYFVLKTPFLTQQLHRAVEQSKFYRSISEDGISLLKNNPKEVLISISKVVGINLIAILLMALIFYLFTRIFS